MILKQTDNSSKTYPNLTNPELKRNWNFQKLLWEHLEKINEEIEVTFDVL